MPTQTENNIDPRTEQVEQMYLIQHIKKNLASGLVSHVSLLATKISQSFYIFYLLFYCMSPILFFSNENFTLKAGLHNYFY